MKKLLVVLLTLVLCVATLTSCDFANQFLENFQLLRGDSINVNEAADYIYNVYKDMSITSTDYELSAKTNVGGISYDVTWSVNTDKVKITKKDDNTYVVDVDERSPEDVSYVLTAVITALDRTTAKKQFNLMVPVYDAISHEEYMAAKKDEVVTIAGIVVAINSKEAGNTRNHLFLADADVTGGYYCYQTKDDPAKLGIEVGMTVKVTGPVTPYGDMQEIKDGQIAILDKTIKKVDVVDITEKFAAGENLGAYVGLPVTIKGVEIGTQVLEIANSQYLYFKLNGKTAYVRTYVTDFPTTLTITTDKDGNATGSPDKEIIDKAHAEHYGWKANASGVLVMYGSDYYLVPTSTNCFEYIEKIVKTPEQKIAEALENLSISTFISEDTTLELPAASALLSEVSFSWTVDKEGYTITDNKIALTVSSTPVELKFTVTATCEGKTGNKEFNVKVALPQMSIAEAVELEDGADVVLVGVVASIDTAWSDQYGNISVVLKDATGELLLYRLKTNVKVGDIITVTGQMGSYNGAKQLAAGGTAEMAKVFTSTEATAAEDSTEVILAGKVTEINTAWSDSYGNISVTITDEAGTFYLYRLSTKVELGDEIVVFGKIGSYNGSKQLAQGGTAIITKKAGEATGPVEVTIEQALELADGKEVILTGVVTEIVGAWSEQYGNMNVNLTDSTGTIYLYRLSTKVELGDVITVTGKVGSYEGAKQIAAGATAEALKVSTSAEATAAEDGTEVVLAGKVTQINTAWDDGFGNITVTITDEAGTFYLFRLSTKVELNDEIIVFGKVGSYEGSKQLAAGSTAVIVKKAPVEEEGEKDALAIKATEGTLAADSLSISWATEKFNVVNEKDKSTTDIRTSDADHFRCYASSKTTISGKNGETIKKIVITATSGSYATALAESVNAVDGLTATADGKVVTIEVNAAIASWSNKAQTRIDNIEIYY